MQDTGLVFKLTYMLVMMMTRTKQPAAMKNLITMMMTNLPPLRSPPPLINPPHLSPRALPEIGTGKQLVYQINVLPTKTTRSSNTVSAEWNYNGIFTSFMCHCPVEVDNLDKYRQFF